LNTGCMSCPIDKTPWKTSNTLSTAVICENTPSNFTTRKIVTGKPCNNKFDFDVSKSNCVVASKTSNNKFDCVDTSKSNCVVASKTSNNNFDPQLKSSKTLLPDIDQVLKEEYVPSTECPHYYDNTCSYSESSKICKSVCSGSESPKNCKSVGSDSGLGSGSESPISKTKQLPNVVLASKMVDPSTILQNACKKQDEILKNKTSKHSDKSDDYNTMYNYMSDKYGKKSKVIPKKALPVKSSCRSDDEDTINAMYDNMYAKYGKKSKIIKKLPVKSSCKSDSDESFY
jgi:hypothetical protein